LWTFYCRKSLNVIVWPSRNLGTLIGSVLNERLGVCQPVLAMAISKQPSCHDIVIEAIHLNDVLVIHVEANKI
jgi:hypothetical protein